VHAKMAEKNETARIQLIQLFVGQIHPQIEFDKSVNSAGVLFRLSGWQKTQV
jgi:hypothetical protein